MLKRNQPMLLERMGKMQSATDVAEYCKYDGFDGLKRAISLSDEEILNELDVAHLRGRGGAAYPLGKKWRHLYHAKGTTKYIVCNADEGEPGRNDHCWLFIFSKSRLYLYARRISQNPKNISRSTG